MVKVNISESPVESQVSCDIGIGPQAAGKEWDKDEFSQLEQYFPSMQIEQEFHRTTNKGMDLYFHRINTNENRIPWKDMLEGLNLYVKIQTDRYVNMAKEDSPELYEDAVSGFGEEKARDIFSPDISKSDSIFPILNTEDEDIQPNILSLIDMSGTRVDENDIENFIKSEFMGRLVRTDLIKRGSSRYFRFGVWPQSPSIDTLKDSVNSVKRNFNIPNSNITIICETFTVSDNKK